MEVPEVVINVVNYAMVQQASLSRLARMERGFWNIPVPAVAEPVRPDVLIIPPVGFDPGGFATPGGPIFLRPATENVSGNLAFSLTDRWSTTMTAQYDITRRDFGSLQVGLQRELHDWNAVFSFSRIPNGNFTFNFFIALKASPELKFNYDRRSAR